MNTFPLSQIDLREISDIIAVLEKSRFNHLDMQIGDLHLTLGQGSHANAATPQASPASMMVAAHASAPRLPSNSAVVQAPSVKPAAESNAAAPAGTVAISSPMVGRFYARPEPGADLYVKVGDHISADTTIGLVEVMKVFNAVTAGVAGEVVALTVQDGEFVEFDQTLAYVKAALA